MTKLTSKTIKPSVDTSLFLHVLLLLSLELLNFFFFALFDDLYILTTFYYNNSVNFKHLNTYTYIHYMTIIYKGSRLLFTMKCKNQLIKYTCKCYSPDLIRLICLSLKIGRDQSLKNPVLIKKIPDEMATFYSGLSFTCGITCISYKQVKTPLNSCLIENWLSSLQQSFSLETNY